MLHCSTAPLLHRSLDLRCSIAGARLAGLCQRRLQEHQEFNWDEFGETCQQSAGTLVSMQCSFSLTLLLPGLLLPLVNSRPALFTITRVVEASDRAGKDYVDDGYAVPDDGYGVPKSSTPTPDYAAPSYTTSVKPCYYKPTTPSLPKYKYTNTALVKVEHRHNICYIFEKVMIRGSQK